MDFRTKKEYGELEKVLKKMRNSLTEAADTIRNENISNYPIIIVSRNDIELGIPLFTSANNEGGWFFRATTLEELHTKNIVNADALDNFRQLYKARAADLCCLIPDAEGKLEFSFIPSA